MKDNQWRNIKTVVDRAMMLSGQEKESYLKAARYESPDLYNEVQELLQSIEESKKINFLEPLFHGYQEIIADMSTNTENKETGTAFIGQEFGAYRIMECIGEGGMGTVYKAERMDGEFHHTVAIKLIKQGVDSKANIRRFKLEREVLAGLNHPNIAQLYDGGINAEGIPYLVMEFVDGIPIDQYCNEHSLTIDERLVLFNNVCSAVQYAHNNLVIHRDLKNQNIFVNRNGVVKILDFGVAKLLAPPPDSSALLTTQPGQRFWTPQYAAPEQIKGTAVTTATDIYMLGVLLYKLLTDEYPLDLEAKNLIEIERTIREEAALPPSRRIQNGKLKRCASRRGVTSSELIKKLSGDLDALVLKAIRKEPDYRYHSVGQLLDDIDNYKKNVPLIARKDTINYRMGKLFRRHKMGISVAVSFLILVVSFAAFYSYRITAERTEAQKEAAKARQVTDFLMQMFNANDPNYAPGMEITAEDLLRTGSKKIEAVQDQPELQAAMMSTIGNLYKHMGIYDQSQTFLEQALDVRMKLYGTSHPSVISSMNELGLAFLEAGNLQKANELISGAYDRNRTVKRTPDIINTATYSNNLGLISMRLGAYDESKTYYQNALKILSDLKQEDAQPIMALALNNLGFVSERTGALEEARRYYEESLNVKKKFYGEEHTSVANTLNNLGRYYQITNKPDSAIYYHQKTLALREKLYDSENQFIAQSLSNIGMVLAREGKYEEAEPYYIRALDIYKKTMGETHRSVGLIYGKLGELYMKNGKDITAAQQYLEDSAEIYLNTLGADHPDLFWSHKRLSDCYRRQTKFVEAVNEFQKALEIHQKHFPDKKEEYAQLQEEFQDLQQQSIQAK